MIVEHICKTCGGRSAPPPSHSGDWVNWVAAVALIAMAAGVACYFMSWMTLISR